MTDCPITPIVAPAGYVPEYAIAFGAMGGSAVSVDAEHPLPTAVTLAAATSTPLQATTASSGLFGPFTPNRGRAIWLTLSGTWSGTVQVLRSADGGTTRLPLTIAGTPWANFTGNVQEVIGEESDVAALWYLSVTLASGTITFRVAQ